jgi:hypothetical protein
MEMDKSFDLDKFKKIEDIIFLDEPILTHLKLSEENYLLYLVENKENSDVFILFKVDEDLLYQYLTKMLSLRSLILKNNIIFQIEQDFNGIIKDYSVVYSENLNFDYLPSKNSFLEYEPTERSYYFKELKKISSKPYLQDLRKDAFYIKFNPLNSEYGTTIGLNELANVFLKNLSTSFSNFLSIEFNKNFSSKFEKKELKNLLKSILPLADYRAVDFKFSSFEMGLSIDKVVNSKIEDIVIKDWVRNIGNEYKDVVLDENISNKEQDKFLLRYSDEERQKIFRPIVVIADMIKVKSDISDNYHDIGLKDKKIAEKLTSQLISKEKPENDIGVIESTISHKISNPYGRTTKKVISNQVLNNYDLKMFLNTIEPTGNRSIIFSKDIEVTMHFDSQSGFRFNFNELGVSSAGLDYNTVFRNFNDELYKKIKLIISGSKNSMDYDIVNSIINNPEEI